MAGQDGVEFNLSDHIENHDTLIPYAAVKEFIKKELQLIGDYNSKKITFVEFLKIRDRLAGEKLR